MTRELTARFDADDSINNNNNKINFFTVKCFLLQAGIAEYLRRHLPCTQAKRLFILSIKRMGGIAK